MALNSTVLFVAQPGSTGQQTYSLGAGFDPKALIAMTVGRGAEGAGSTHLRFSLGFATFRGGVVQQRWLSNTSEDGAGTSDTYGGNGNDALLKLTNGTTATVDMEVDFVSFQSDGVTLDWVNLDSSSTRIMLVVLGGSDLEDALVSDFTTPTSGTTQDVTVASGFGQPDLVMFHSQANTAIQSAMTNGMWSAVGYGVKGISDNGLGIFNGAADASGTAATWQRTNTTSAISSYYTTSTTGGTPAARTIFGMSADSGWPTDGFELTYTTTSNAETVCYLALRFSTAVAVNQGATTARTTTGTTTLASADTPKLCMVMGNRTTTTNSLVGDTNTMVGMVGFADGSTNQGVASYWDDDGAGTTITGTSWSESSILRFFASNNTGSTPTGEAVAQISGSDFVANWTNAAASAWDYVFLTIGVAASAPSNADAGVDANVRIFDDFTRTGTADGSPDTHQWTIESGPEGVGTVISSAAALTWRPMLAGTYVLRYTASNAMGSDFDDVTVTVSGGDGPGIDILMVTGDNGIDALPGDRAARDALIDILGHRVVAVRRTEDPEYVGAYDVAWISDSVAWTGGESLYQETAKPLFFANGGQYLLEDYGTSGLGLINVTQIELNGTAPDGGFGAGLITMLSSADDFLYVGGITPEGVVLAFDPSVPSRVIASRFEQGSRNDVGFVHPHRRLLICNKPDAYMKYTADAWTLIDSYLDWLTAAPEPFVAAGLNASGPLGATLSRTPYESLNGNTVVSRTWSVVSGPAEVGNTIGTSQTLTWSPSAAGSYVVRYTLVTSGGTSTDEFSVEVAAAATPATYRYFRWTSTQLRDEASQSIMQISEFELSGNFEVRSGATVTAGANNNSPGAEGPEKAHDALTSTKWLNFNGTQDVPLIYDFGSPVLVDQYRIATANDAETRDPISWTVEGSDNGTDWTLLDTRTSYATPTDRFTYTSPLGLEDAPESTAANAESATVEFAGSDATASTAKDALAETALLAHAGHDSGVSASPAADSGSVAFTGNDATVPTSEAAEGPYPSSSLYPSASLFPGTAPTAATDVSPETANVSVAAAAPGSSASVVPDVATLAVVADSATTVALSEAAAEAADITIVSGAAQGSVAANAGSASVTCAGQDATSTVDSSASTASVETTAEQASSDVRCAASAAAVVLEGHDSGSSVSASPTAATVSVSAENATVQAFSTETVNAQLASVSVAAEDVTSTATAAADAAVVDIEAQDAASAVAPVVSAPTVAVTAFRSTSLSEVIEAVVDLTAQQASSTVAVTSQTGEVTVEGFSSRVTVEALADVAALSVVARDAATAAVAETEVFPEAAAVSVASEAARGAVAAPSGSAAVEVEGQQGDAAAATSASVSVVEVAAESATAQAFSTETVNAQPASVAFAAHSASQSALISPVTAEYDVVAGTVTPSVAVEAAVAELSAVAEDATADATVVVEAAVVDVETQPADTTVTATPDTGTVSVAALNAPPETQSETQAFAQTANVAAAGEDADTGTAASAVEADVTVLATDSGVSGSTTVQTATLSVFAQDTGSSFTGTAQTAELDLAGQDVTSAVDVRAGVAEVDAVAESAAASILPNADSALLDVVASPIDANTSTGPGTAEFAVTARMAATDANSRTFVEPDEANVSVNAGQTTSTITAVNDLAEFAIAASDATGSTAVSANAATIEAEASDAAAAVSASAVEAEVSSTGVDATSDGSSSPITALVAVEGQVALIQSESNHNTPAESASVAISAQSVSLSVTFESDVAGAAFAGQDATVQTLAFRNAEAETAELDVVAVAAQSSVETNSDTGAITLDGFESTVAASPVADTAPVEVAAEAAAASIDAQTDEAGLTTAAQAATTSSATTPQTADLSVDAQAVLIASQSQTFAQASVAVVAVDSVEPVVSAAPEADCPIVDIAADDAEGTVATVGVADQADLSVAADDAVAAVDSIASEAAVAVTAVGPFSAPTVNAMAGVAVVEVITQDAAPKVAARPQTSAVSTVAPRPGWSSTFLANTAEFTIGGREADGHPGVVGPAGLSSVAAVAQQPNSAVGVRSFYAGLVVAADGSKAEVPALIARINYLPIPAPEIIRVDVATTGLGPFERESAAPRATHLPMPSSEIIGYDRITGRE